MRVLVAPDAFGGPLTAVEAGLAIGRGWMRGAPHDSIDIAPMSAGGVGFVDVMHGTLGGELVVTSVTGPAGGPVPATFVRIGSYAYVEAAQACGSHLAPGPLDLWRATSYGVGELIAHALDAGATRIVVGLASVATNDGGAGVLAALSAEPGDDLRAGPAGLRSLAAVDVTRPRGRMAEIELVAATDVENPLLGLRGTTNVYGVARGATAGDLVSLDAALEHYADLIDRKAASTSRAGAGGGIAYALGQLGGVYRPALDLVLELVDLREKALQADLVITGTRTFDATSLRGEVVAAVAATVGPTGRPCIVLADEVEVGRREMNAYGIEAAYAVADLVRGSGPPVTPADELSALAERVARSWSPLR